MGRTLELRISDSEISQQHLQLRRTDDEWELFDLGSDNGTLVNGLRTEHAVLVDGDLIEIGAAMLVYRDAGLGLRDAGDLDVAAAAGIPAALRNASLELEEVAAALMKIAPSPVPVLIRGETGTGKELVARAIHERSGRHGAFIPVNCRDLSRAFIENERVGIKLGAREGRAVLVQRAGLVLRADRGTLFLDKIDELPLESQVALLRVLQEGEVRPVVLQEGEVHPVGGVDMIRVDVRVVAATDLNLEDHIEEGWFLQDLYARLAGYDVTLPPLRTRREDIGTLIGVLLGRIAADPASITLQQPAARALFLYPYPFNIRELEQALRTAVTLAGGRQIALEHLPGSIRTYRPGDHQMRPEDRGLRDKLVESLREHRGNVAAVARGFGKEPIQIRRWCRRFGVEIASFRNRKQTT